MITLDEKQKLYSEAMCVARSPIRDPTKAENSQVIRIES